MRELTSLMQVSQALNEASVSIQSCICFEQSAPLGSEEGSIILIDPPNSNRLRIVAERGLGSEVVEAFNNRPVYTHQGTYRRALRTRQLSRSPTLNRPDFLHDVGSRARQVTNIPLVTDRGPIGSLPDGLPRDETTRQLLTTLAGRRGSHRQRTPASGDTARLSEVSTLYPPPRLPVAFLPTSSGIIVSILR